MEFLVPLLTLTLMEVVLGIDNIVFLSILVGALPAEKQKLARFVGLGLALLARLGLLLGIKWVMGLESPLFHWSSLGWIPPGWVESHHVDIVTGRDVVLIVGGIFLLGKSVTEIHKKVAGNEGGEVASKAKGASFASVLAQIVVLDLVFSLDSVISAIGMAKDIWVMVVAMVVAVGFMGAFAGRVSRFIDTNPTFKMLGLSFLMMIGILLFAEGVGTPINKNYVYAAMIFSLLVEVLNTRARRKAAHEAIPEIGEPAKSRAPR